ncbi:hypothetical protein [Nocardia sp. NPDC023988]|uniref:hypothetical protein n=1 Tax=unclassified Nocardia TaxID=2637762 RepID=UPI0033CE8C48
MGEREQVGHGGGTDAILERIAGSPVDAVGTEVPPGQGNGVRPEAHRKSRLVRVLVCSSVFIAALLLVLLCVGVAWFGFLIFLF